MPSTSIYFELDILIFEFLLNLIFRQVGTTVTLTNLFFSLPVRQKEFHRNLKREFSKATHLLSAYCLISTNVKYVVLQVITFEGFV